MTMINGNPLSDLQKRLHAANIARLQYQKAFGVERPNKPATSLLDLVENVSAKSVAAIPLQRVL
jgi:hypothetical protein